jgi:hypothetical protein
MRLEEINKEVRKLRNRTNPEDHTFGNLEKMWGLNNLFSLTSNISRSVSLPAKELDRQEFEFRYQLEIRSCYHTDILTQISEEWYRLIRARKQARLSEQENPRPTMRPPLEGSSAIAEAFRKALDAN